MKAKWLIFILAFLLISINAYAADGDLIVNGKLGVGTTSPATPLEVNGDVRIGNSSASCTSSIEGAVRYNTTSKHLEFCNGTDWLSSNYGWTDTYTKLLLHFDGTNGSTSFVDSSTANHSVTAFGNTEVSIEQFKFGGSGAKFNGAGDYLSITDSADWNFGTGDFTIDFWFQLSTLQGSTLIGQNADPASNYWTIAYGSNSITFDAFFASSLALRFSFPIGTVSQNTWYHIAIVRNGNTSGTWHAFVNGVEQTKTLLAGSYAMTMVDLSTPLRIGSDASTYGNFNGYLDELRISKGIARWTSTFTPPTVPY